MLTISSTQPPTRREPGLSVRQWQISQQEWFSSYAAAVLEDDAQVLPPRIEKARRAIAERFSSLNAGESPLHLEPRHLKKALATLDLLERQLAV